MKNIIFRLGLLIFLGGAGFFYFNEHVYVPQKKANQFLKKGKLFFEQNDNDSLQKAINQFATAITRFPQTQQAKEAMFYLAQSYQRLGMNDIAISKYNELLDAKTSTELKTQARQKIRYLEKLESYQKDGLSGLTKMLKNSQDHVLRSEIYLEMARQLSRSGQIKEALEHYAFSLKENSNNIAAWSEWKKLKELFEQENSFSSFRFRGKEPQREMAFSPKTVTQKQVRQEKEKIDNTLPFQEKPVRATTEKKAQQKGAPSKNESKDLAIEGLLKKILSSLDFLKKEKEPSPQEKIKPHKELHSDKEKAAQTQDRTSHFEAQEYVIKGIELYNKNLDSQAENYFDFVIEKYPDTAAADDALYYSGNIAFRNQDLTRAIYFFNEALSNQNKKRDEISYIRKGEAYYHRGDYLRAANVFETVQKLYPNGRYNYIARDWQKEVKDAYFNAKEKNVDQPQLTSQEDRSSKSTPSTQEMLTDTDSKEASEQDEISKQEFPSQNSTNTESLLPHL